MRDEIKEIIHNGVFKPNFKTSVPADIAEAIIAALPSMVKPLEWGGDYDDSASDDFCGYHVGEGHDDMWFFSRTDYPCHDESEHIYETKDDAKEAVHALRVSFFMKAFGIEEKADG